MPDEDLFTTFVTATPEQLITAAEELLGLPWNTGADATAEHSIAGLTVTSSEDADVHELEFIRSTDFAGDPGERISAVMNRVAPVVVAVVDATTAAWGEPSVFREAEDPRACTLFEVIMNALGIDEVLAWQRGERYILFFEGVQQDSDEYAAAFWIVARSVVEDVAYDITAEPGEEDMPWIPSALERHLIERFGPEVMLPEPLCRAWSFMQAKGWGGVDAHGDPILTPYPGDEQLGSVFSSSLSTRGWLDPDAPGAERLVPIAQTDGSGGFAAMWFDDSGAPRFVWFSSESGQAQQLADDPVDFLRLIAMGYSEFADWVWGRPPDSFADTHPEEDEGGEELLMSDPVVAHGEFRAWVEAEFDVEVPDVWTVCDDPEFDAWLTSMVQAHGIGDQEAVSSASTQATVGRSSRSDGGGMDVDEAWDVIERVLGEVRPDVAATLRGPASEADLEALAQTVGRDLPADLLQSLRRHDGQDNPTRLLGAFDHHILLSARAMLEQSDMLADAIGDDVGDVIEWMTPEKVRPISNCRGWLQFTDAEGQGYALDLDPLPAGDVGQVIYLPIDGPTPAPEFTSYRAWLSDYAERLEAGSVTLDGDAPQVCGGPGEDTALHRSARGLSPESVQRDLDAGADPDASDSVGWTPLELVAFGTEYWRAQEALDTARVLITVTEKKTIASAAVSHLRSEFRDAHRAHANGNLGHDQLQAFRNLLELLSVPEPVLVKPLAPGEQIAVSSLGWKRQFSELWQLLVPENGTAESVQGEVIRIAGRVGHEILSNGGGNWDEDFEAMLDAFLAFTSQGEPLPDADHDRARRATAELRGGQFSEEDVDELTRASVAWALLNPAPIRQPAPRYRR